MRFEINGITIETVNSASEVALSKATEAMQFLPMWQKLHNEASYAFGVNGSYIDYYNALEGHEAYKAGQAIMAGLDALIGHSKGSQYAPLLEALYEAYVVATD